MNRDLIYKKYDGRCAYSGTPLEDDWQIDHVVPQVKSHFIEFSYNSIKTYGFDNIDHINNLVPCQRRINHYKRGVLIDDIYNPRYNFRHRILNLHNKLKKLPENPRTEKSIKRKEYLLQVATYFGITPNKPFDGWFYFEKIELAEWFKV